MDLALAMLVLWALLFVPVGLALHGLVLGEAARVRALPLAPITGLAIVLLALSLLARLGVDAGNTWVAVCMLVVSAACAIVVWRRDIAWRSRELIGAGLLLLLAVFLVQIPVVGGGADGPLGYGTAANPVREVAAIDAAVGGAQAAHDVAREAARTARERPVAFEQLAALTVAIGSSDDDAPAGALDQSSWSAYSMHAPITGMLAALVALPLFAFARARGMRWFGLVFLVPVGVLAPYTFLALANGSGAAIAAIPLTAAAIFSLLVTKRDRGWWSLAMIFGAAVAVSAGPLAIVPLLTTGIAWMLLRTTTYEHLAQTDVPVARLRALAPGCLAIVVGVIGILSVLRSGDLLAWPQLHDTVGGAVRSWPFAWLDTDLSTAGPRTPVEVAIWLAGPVLLFIAAIHGILRNERRELSVLVGAVIAAGVGLLASAVERDAGIRLYEYSLLVVSPLLAALAVRGVALARDAARESASRGRLVRVAGYGPLVLAVGFVLLSLASTSVTGTRMVHAPALERVAVQEGRSIVAGGDPWLAFVVDGPRVPGGYEDADHLGVRTATRGEAPLSRWDTIVLSSSPLASDPPPRFGEDPALDSYQARLFYDRAEHPDAGQSLLVRSELTVQEDYTPFADKRQARRSGGTARDQVQRDAERDVTDPAAPAAIRHDPVETRGVTRPDQPAGLLLPGGDVRGCDSARARAGAAAGSSACEPDAPVLGAACDERDRLAVRSELDTPKRASEVEGSAAAPAVPAGSGVLSTGIDDDQLLVPPLLGVQCFDVELEPDATSIMVHLRNIGLIIPPSQATRVGGASAWTRRGADNGVLGGHELVSNRSGAALEFGGGRLAGESFDVVAEGSFGAGMSLESTVVGYDTESGTTESVGRPLASLRGSADGYSAIARGVQLQGTVTLRNSSGTDVEIGRVFVRPRDIPAACNVVVGLGRGELRELRTESVDSTLGRVVQRPGITVAVVDVAGSGRTRTARIAVGSYLTFGGLPRYVLVDWTEQFGAPVTTLGCDGELHEEAGVTPRGAEPLVVVGARDRIVTGFGSGE